MGVFGGTGEEMADSETLGVDLYSLWRAGKDNYPSVADQIAEASSSINAAESGLTFAFWQPDAFGGGTYGPVYQRWRDLRDDLVKILDETRTNLTDTAEALCMAVTTYIGADDQARTAFQALLKSRGEPRPGPS
jgi:hypothetical protein